MELGLGEVEQGGGLDQRQVVLHPKGAEAGAEVARAEAGAQQKVKGVAVVVAELFAKGPLLRGIMEEESGVVVEVVEEFIERVVAQEAGEPGGVVERALGGVGAEQEFRQPIGRAGGDARRP